MGYGSSTARHGGRILGLLGNGEARVRGDRGTDRTREIDGLGSPARTRCRRRARLAERCRRRATQVLLHRGRVPRAALGRRSARGRCRASRRRLRRGRSGPGRILPRRAPVDPDCAARRRHQHRPSPPRCGEGARAGSGADLRRYDHRGAALGPRRVLAPARARSIRGRLHGAARACRSTASSAWTCRTLVARPAPSRGDC